MLESYFSKQKYVSNGPQILYSHDGISRHPLPVQYNVLSNTARGFLSISLTAVNQAAKAPLSHTWHWFSGISLSAVTSPFTKDRKCVFQGNRCSGDGCNQQSSSRNGRLRSRGCSSPFFFCLSLMSPLLHCQVLEGTSLFPWRTV